MGEDLAGAHCWLTVGASVAGTSHADAGEPCADSCGVRELTSVDGRSLLVAVAADGAGSSERAREGAIIACETVLELAKAWACPSDVPAGRPPRDLSSFDGAEVRRWVEAVRSRIEQAASSEERPVRDFSCTLIVALVDESQAVFFQIGDGAVVYRGSEGPYRLAFWPQLGEYANLTWFVTDDDATDHVQSVMAEDVHEVALLTDGLQGLALRFASRDAHGPFFEPMFKRLRKESEDRIEGLRDELTRFLDSAAVNQRTDDDKTLVLATRLSGEQEASPQPAGKG
jgi:hypothetical protein